MKNNIRLLLVCLVILMVQTIVTAQQNGVAQLNSTDQYRTLDEVLVQNVTEPKECPSIATLLTTEQWSTEDFSAGFQNVRDASTFILRYLRAIEWKIDTIVINDCDQWRIDTVVIDDRDHDKRYVLSKMPTPLYCRIDRILPTWSVSICWASLCCTYDNQKGQWSCE
jgi:hypothetical protein